MYDETALRARYSDILAGIGDALSRSGRQGQTVALVAVCKNQTIEAVEAAYRAGIRHFGENRVQEAELKFGPLKSGHPDIILDMVGHLQSNKIGRSVNLFDCIQSIDSPDLLKKLLDRWPAGRGPDLFFEFHTAEESKSGFRSMDDLYEACGLIEQFRNGSLRARMRGLMTIAPDTNDATRVRRSFTKLRELRGDILSRFDLPECTELSMGMSGDYAIAVEEGATMVRIGTALFGSRMA